MIKEFNSIEKLKKYYNKETNTYIFKENGEYIDLIKFNFDLNIKANIDACDIDARDIKAIDIDARDIKARNIKADNIIYYAICFAYKNIRCKSIKGRIKNSKHLALDGKIEIKGVNK